MSKFELKLPKMGESVAEATLTAWLKEIGDTIEFDEPVVEIATDKVDSEVPSEKKGILIEKCFYNKSICIRHRKNYFKTYHNFKWNISRENKK